MTAGAPSAEAGHAGSVEESSALEPRSTGPERPLFHLSPPRGWLSDPVGLVVVDGSYHAFFQHYPDGDDWGPMHWGHAVSTDLVSWQHRGVALAPDADGMIFSGSAVVDPGTGSRPAGTVVAAYTRHSPDREVQCLALSTDGGASWVRDPAGPVLEPAEPTPDFRDPRLLRWHSSAGDHWVMLVAAGQGIELYTSPDLETWQFASRFARPSHAAEAWETPDLMPLRAPDGSVSWVLTIGAMTAGPESPTQVRYFVGDFDGREFSCPAGMASRLADFGPDFYAAQCWSGASEPVWTGWLGNWAYARSTPADGWRGVLAIPRVLALVDGPGGLRLAQRPVPQLDDLPWTTGATGAVAVAAHWIDLLPAAAAIDLTLVLDPALVSAVELGIGGAVLCWTDGVLDLDLSGASAGVDDTWGLRRARHRAEVGRGRCELRLVVDRCVLEVFAAEGAVVMSAELYGARPRIAVQARVPGAVRSGGASESTTDQDPAGVITIRASRRMDAVPPAK